MYCQNCGSRLPEGTSFCPNCGAGVGQQIPAPKPPKKKNGLLIALTALVAVLFVATVVLVIVLVAGGSDSGGSSSSRTDKDDEDTGKAGASSAEAAAEAFIVGWFSDDVDAMLRQVPDELIEASVEKGVYGSVSESRRDLKNTLQDAIDDLYDEVLYNADSRDVKVKVSGLKKDLDETEYMENEVLDAYDEFNITIKDFAAYTGKITVTVDGEKETFDDFYVTVVKLGNRWYIDVYSIFDELFEPFI